VARLTEEERSELRAEFTGGASPGELALAYGISERHVRRLCADVERHLPEVEGQSRTRSRWFLDGLELDAASLVVAQAARLVARRLDRADARTTSPLAERLVALCQQLSLKHRVLMRSTPW
jgi:hypothetical protein